MKSVQFAASLFGFKGRAPRLHYWVGQVFFILAYRILTVFMHRLSEEIRADRGPRLSTAGFGPYISALMLLLAVFAVTFYLSFALTVRRWHDRDKSWAWALLGFVPVVGWLWQGVECGFLEGTLGPNRYGPSPKGVAGVVYEGANPEAT